MLGRFQMCQDFIPLHKLLGEKQGLDMTLKESNCGNCEEETKVRASRQHRYNPDFSGEAQGTRLLKAYMDSVHPVAEPLLSTKHPQESRRNF